MSSLTTIQSRLPMPAGVSIEQGVWRVLCESIFPSARSPEAVVMAIDYCKARKLDILKKPVHIVPMWSSSLNKEVETVWPSITEVQTTAARTGKYAGMDKPEFGPMITREFSGVRGKNVGATKVSVTFPEWCAVTVYKMVDGQRCAFTEPVYWLEAYAHIGKTELPNDQWCRRAMGMIIKVAKAFSLRAAFPEEGTHTAEEMEGRVLEEVDASGVVIDGSKPLKKGSPFKNSSLRNTFIDNVTKSFDDAKTNDELTQIMELNQPKFDEMAASDSDHDTMALDLLRQRFKLAWNRLVNQKDPTPAEDADTFDNDDVPPYIRQQMEEESERLAALGAR